MAKQPVKAKPKAKEKPVPGILEALGYQDPDKAQNEPQTQQNQGSEHAKTLEKRLEDLQAQLDSVTRTNMALMATPSGGYGGGQQQAPAPIELDLNGLPDPLDDADAYNKELAKRMNTVIQSTIQANTTAQTAEQRRQQQASQQYDALYEAFSDKYEDYAQHPDRIEYVSTRVVKKAQARGLDVDRYMRTEQFLDDVAKEYQKEWPDQPPGGGDETGEDDAEGADNTNKGGGDEETGDASRASSIFGGFEGGTKPGGKQTADEKGDLITDLKDMQKASGFW